MSVRRMLGVAALGATVTSLAFLPGAGAQEPATYGASSSGEALRLSVFGEELTVGRTVSELDSTIRAIAEGVGVATPAFEAGTSSAAAEGEGADGSAEPVCEGVIDQIPGLSIALACSSSFVEIVDAAPRSVATGTIGDIVVNPVAPLLETPLADVVEPVDGGVEQLLDGLRPVTSGVDEATGLGLEDTLDDLFGALFDGADLVSIALGDAVAETVVAADVVSSRCASQGGRIDVLDLPATAAGVDPEPVVSVIVSDALTTVDVNTADGTATADVTPALLSVVVPSLGIDQALEVGQTIEIPLPEPFGTSVISVADGTIGVTDDGRTFATANAVHLDLLNGEAMQGGVELAIAGCTSIAGATPAQLPVESQPTLPTTGSDGPNPFALAAAVGLAGLGLTLVRRTRTTD